MNFKYLNEGLVSGDLKDLVKSIVSIDEFIPKIDPKAIVLAFYVREEDPAYDLSRFIELGPIDEVLDTEVSPAPDENGFYLVFVEIESKNLSDIAKITLRILEIVKYLTDIKEWNFSYMKKKGKISL